MSLGRVLMWLGTAVLVAAASASAGIVFDMGPGDVSSNRSAGTGAGQGIVVDTSTWLTSMSVYAAIPGGGQLEFVIFDASNSALLYSSIVDLGAGASPGWVQSAPFSFHLLAGNTYYFGALANNPVVLNFVYPAVHVSQSGLASIDGANVNYINFAVPTATDIPGGANLSLRLEAEVPEPAAGALLMFGVLGIFLLHHFAPAVCLARVPRSNRPARRK